MAAFQQPNRRMGRIFQRKQRLKKMKNAKAESSRHLLPASQETSEFDRRNIRSSLSTKHLQTDGSSAEQLNTLLETVAVIQQENKTVENTTKSLVTRSQGDRHSTPARKESNVQDSAKKSDENKNSIKNSRRSLISDDSSERRLESLQIVKQETVAGINADDCMRKTWHGSTDYERKDIMPAHSKLSQQSQNPPLDGISIDKGNKRTLSSYSPSKPRYDMESNENARLYLNLRKLKSGKKKKSGINDRTKDILMNCGITQELTLIPGSDRSMSTCSMDSVLEDPLRLERYRMLNDLAKSIPPPPPRSNGSKRVKDEGVSFWASNVAETVKELYAKWFSCDDI